MLRIKDKVGHFISHPSTLFALVFVIMGLATFYTFKYGRTFAEEIAERSKGAQPHHTSCGCPGPSESGPPWLPSVSQVGPEEG
jgi:hypothetical protein